MVSDTQTVNNVEKNGVEMQISKIDRRACGRCGGAIKEHAFCPTCEEFFRRLSDEKTAFVKVVRKTQTRRSGVSGK